LSVGVTRKASSKRKCSVQHTQTHTPLSLSLIKGQMFGTTHIHTHTHKRSNVRYRTHAHTHMHIHTHTHTHNTHTQTTSAEEKLHDEMEQLDKAFSGTLMHEGGSAPEINPASASVPVVGSSFGNAQPPSSQISQKYSI